MKNIHILSTPNPSKVYSYKGNSFLTTESHLHSPSMEYQNIYITSDEEIKEADWYISILENEVYKATNETQNIMSVANLVGSTSYKKTHFKIILTTDQDLIKDGVQAIDDEFLEWFVNNPSCEEVELKMIPRCACGKNGFKYSCKSYAYSNVSGDVCAREVLKIPYEIIIPKEEPKQETLEEVADRLYPYEVGYGVFDRNCEIDAERQRFIEGVEWQQEQDNNKYSDEDVIELLKTFDEKFNSGIVERNKGINNWFEQFKKK